MPSKKKLTPLQKEYLKAYKRYTLRIKSAEKAGYVIPENKLIIKKKKPRTKVYYAHPYRSEERGSNENANRLIRRFIPKGTVITNISEKFIQEIEDWINNLLRPMFGFKSSLEMAKLAL